MSNAAQSRRLFEASHWIRYIQGKNKVLRSIIHYEKDWSGKSWEEVGKLTSRIEGGTRTSYIPIRAKMSYPWWGLAKQSRAKLIGAKFSDHVTDMGSWHSKYSSAGKRFQKQLQETYFTIIALFWGRLYLIIIITSLGDAMATTNKLGLRDVELLPLLRLYPSPLRCYM